MRSRRAVEMGEWVRVRLRRKGRRTRLEVGGQGVVRSAHASRSSATSSHLNLALPLYLGKVPMMPR